MGAESGPLGYLDPADFFFLSSLLGSKDPPGIVQCLERRDLDNTAAASANPKKTGPCYLHIAMSLAEFSTLHSSPLEGGVEQAVPSLLERKRAGCPHRELLAEIPFP